MKLIKQWPACGLNDLAQLAHDIKAAVDLPAVLLLDGPLGAGKTALAQHFAPELTSPTYALMQEVGRVAHADLFRIEEAEELIHLEIPLYLENKDLFLVEWGTAWASALGRLIEGPFTFYLVAIQLLPNTNQRQYHLWQIDPDEPLAGNHEAK